MMAIGLITTSAVAGIRWKRGEIKGFVGSDTQTIESRVDDDLVIPDLD